MDPAPRWKDLVGPGTWTDLAVNLLVGTQVTDHGDHLELRTPDNPTYYWGNALQVLDPDAGDDAARWVARFRALFPDAAHIAIGLPREPAVGAYEAFGLEVSREQALGAATVDPRATGSGIVIRPLVSDGDWADSEVLFRVENDREGRFPGPVEYADFLRRRVVARRALVATGAARFFGAFAGGDLVGHCGMVLCGDVGRFQSVLVDAAHRRGGVASALVVAAGRWGLEHGARELVILADAGSPAEGLYRGLGFTDLQLLVGAERRP